jgi:site-specific recombinase XerD
MGDLDPKLKVEKTHNFRKTRMTHLYKCGMSVQAISKLVMHKNIETTFRYLEIPEEQAMKELKAFDRKNLRHQEYKEFDE